MPFPPLLLVCGLTAGPTPPVLRNVGSAWPPSGVDATRRWDAEHSAGPLGRQADALFERMFRRGLVTEMGRDAPEEGFDGVIRLTRELVAERISSGDGASGVTGSARRVLTKLFPDWPPLALASLWSGCPPTAGRRGLLYWFEVLFARPFPVFSARLNAYVTYLAGQWLMGPCTVEDLSAEDAAASVVGDGTGQQLLVHRCRFLEESACASVCVNACKMPTQLFFNEEMGVPMRMEPDYETLECRFKFGLRPTAADEAEARSVSCFSACPSGGALREVCPSMGGGSAAAQEAPKEPYVW